MLLDGLLSFFLLCCLVVETGKLSPFLCSRTKVDHPENAITSSYKIELLQHLLRAYAQQVRIGAP